jgi:hypothetical protein
VLLYGDNPPTGEPTLELLRRPLPVGEESASAARAILDRTLPAWGWKPWVHTVTQCLSEVLAALSECEPDSLELFAFRRPNQLDVELHFTGVDIHFHKLVGTDPARARALALVDELAPLWGVRPIADGEAVWFEFR